MKVHTLTPTFEPVIVQVMFESLQEINEFISEYQNDYEMSENTVCRLIEQELNPDSEFEYKLVQKNSEN